MRHDCLPALSRHGYKRDEILLQPNVCNELLYPHFRSCFCRLWQVLTTFGVPTHPHLGIERAAVPPVAYDF
jgi:hypothetical protein